MLFRSGVEMTREQFWAWMTSPEAPFPKTAASSPGDFQAVYEAAFAAGAEGIVSVHVALTPQTQNLLTAELLGQLKDDAIFVNTARGEIIDESALVELLRAQRIRGAALDVFVDEPLSPDHVLRQFDNVVLTPHTAYNTPEASARILDIALDNVLAYFSGDPMNVVN